MDILQLVMENRQYIVDWRRHFHRHPELSDQEHATIATISQELTALGIAHQVVENGGILGFIEGAGPGKTVLLRADVDALPVVESQENLAGPRVCRSENEGVMHACGHDGHTAMLLCAAKILQENRTAFQGRVVLMFERGEEGTGNVSYLYNYIDRHNIHIDSSYGCHLYAMLESGKIALLDGPVMAGAVTFDVTITGRGGHGSRPDQSNNPIDCFYSLYGAMNALRMREASPFRAMTWSVGTLHAGNTYNVIPDTLQFAGSARVFDLQDGFRFKEMLEKMAADAGDMYGCQVEAKVTSPMPPVLNDPACAAMAREAVGQAVGQARVVPVEPWMASESMCFTLTMWPGVFALVGIQNQEKGTGAAHHNDKFDIDEDALPLGTAAAVGYALGFLAGDIDTSETRFQGTAKEMYTMLQRDLTAFEA